MLLLQVVKAIWQYVKSRNLQDPNDRRQIICDDALRAVCDGESAVSGFGINKYISRHLLRPAAIPPGEEEEYVSVPTKKRRKRKEREEKKKKSVKRRQTGTSGLTKPYRLSKTLAAVVGKDIMSRVDVVRAIWAYVKDNQLQDPADKRTIVCDEKLKAVVDGNDTVTGFTINKFLSQHMLEPITPPAPPAQMEPAGGAGGHHHHHHHHHHMHHGMPEDEEDVEDEDAYDDIGGYR
ncbi:spp27 [Symbiodinium sp. KB8]|nr:spp27 [Symbiodinium sp. KB8]